MTDCQRIGIIASDVEKHPGVDSDLKSMVDAYYELEAENKRLRGVMESIARGWCCQTEGYCEEVPLCDAMAARRALSGKLDQY